MTSNTNEKSSSVAMTSRGTRAYRPFCYRHQRLVTRSLMRQLLSDQEVDALVYAMGPSFSLDALDHARGELAERLALRIDGLAETMVWYDDGTIEEYTDILPRRLAVPDDPDDPANGPWINDPHDQLCDYYFWHATSDDPTDRVGIYGIMQKEKKYYTECADEVANLFNEYTLNNTSTDYYDKERLESSIVNTPRKRTTMTSTDIFVPGDGFVMYIVEDADMTLITRGKRTNKPYGKLLEKPEQTECIKRTFSFPETTYICEKNDEVICQLTVDERTGQLVKGPTEPTETGQTPYCIKNNHGLRSGVIANGTLIDAYDYRENDVSYSKDRVRSVWVTKKAGAEPVLLIAPTNKRQRN